MKKSILYGLMTMIAIWDFAQNISGCNALNNYKNSSGPDYVMSALEDLRIELSTDAGDLIYEGHTLAMSIRNRKNRWELLVE